MSKCNCIENNAFDFILEFAGCDVLRFQDLSKWATGANYEQPVSYDLVLSMGGGGRKVTVKTDGVTILKPEAMGFDGTFPEGIICAKLDSCEDSYVRYRLLCCKTQCCLDQLVYQLAERDARDSEYVAVERLQRLLGIAQRAAETKDIEFSKNLFDEVKAGVDELNCNCKCK